MEEDDGLDSVAGPGHTAEAVGAAEVLMDPAGMLEVADLMNRAGSAEAFLSALVQVEAVAELVGGVEEPMESMALASHPSTDSTDE